MKIGKMSLLTILHLGLKHADLLLNQLLSLLQGITLVRLRGNVEVAIETSVVHAV
jgi:hypothetical protein